jgi:hypothetical protein
MGLESTQTLTEMSTRTFPGSKEWPDERYRVRVPDDVNFLNLSNPSSRTMTLESTQPLTKMNTRTLPRSKGWPARKADNLTSICELIVWKMWESRHLTALWTSTACYRDNCTFYLLFPYFDLSTRLHSVITKKTKI